METKLTAAYVLDDEFRIECNLRNENYWYTYIQEIWEQLGLRPKKIAQTTALENYSALAEIGTLILGDIPGSKITENIKHNLERWVESGGTLIGFSTEGLDSVFGNTYFHTTEPLDHYAISATFDLKPDPLTEGVHSYLHPEQRLLIFSPIRWIKPKYSIELGRLYNIDGADSHFSAITGRCKGEGNAYYFSFNVAQTIWILHQGRPAVKDVDGDNYLRTMDLIVIGDNNPEVLYSDEILLVLQNMIGRKPHPFIFQLPPTKGNIPDTVFHWGGDDHSRPQMARDASDWMRIKGLPYHINLMPSKDLSFKVQQTDVDYILRNNHEVSLHYNFVSGYNHPCYIRKEDVLRQFKAFKKEFNIVPICSTNHFIIWTGWTEMAEMLMATGSLADNSFLGRRYPPMDPANTLSFPGGTSYPFYFYKDHSGKNERIDFLEEPITAYEPGHPSDGRVDYEIIHKIVDISAKYHLIMNLFYHPQYIGDESRKNTRAAINEIIEYIEKLGIIALHMGQDEVCRWWNSRSESRIEEAYFAKEAVTLSVSTEYSEGVVVKVPLGSSTNVRVTCDSEKATFKVKREFAQNWVYTISPRGEHSIHISWSQQERPTCP